MSDTVIFVVGCLVFLATLTGAFLYGWMTFEELRRRDERSEPQPVRASGDPEAWG